MSITLPKDVRTPVVWVVNDGGHDYAPAEQFGRVMFLTQGPLNPFKLDRLSWDISKKLTLAQEDDYVLVSGLQIVHMLVTAMWLLRFRRLRALQWNNKSHTYQEVLIGVDPLMRVLNYYEDDRARPA